MSIFTSNIELSSDNYPTIRTTLDLNFAATKTLDRRITFTRDSAGTYVDELGIIRYATNNVPRFDHDPTTGESLGLLIEESRTNYAVYSSEFDNAAHNKLGSTVTANQAVAPDGTTTADLLYPNSNGTGKGLEGIYTLPSTGIYTTSLYVKSAGLSWVQLYAVNGGKRAFFNVSTGTKGSEAGTGSLEDWDIIDAGNGWYRIYVTYNLSSIAGGEYYYVYFADSDGNNSVTANGTNGVHIWGLQVEKGSFPTSYIPTNGSTVTRGSDTAQITGTNFTDFYNQNEGTLVLSADIGYLATSNQAAVVFEDTSGQSTDLIALGYRVGGGASGGLGGWYQGNGAQVIYQHHSVGVTANSEFRQALAYKTDDFASVANGTTPLTDNSGTLSTSIDRVRFGEYYADGMTSGHIRQFKYYNKRLPDAQLQGLTQQ